MSENQEQPLIPILREMLGELAGKDLGSASAQATFFELGFDSLLLTQVATALKKRFRVKVTFRQLLEESGQLYLVPLNPTYPKQPFTDDCHILGVVVQAMAKF